MTHPTFAAVAAAMIGMAAAFPGAAASANDVVDDDPFFGINGVAYFHYRDSDDAAEIAAARIDLLKRAGARADRFDFWWGVTEPSPGEPDWTIPDRVIDLYEKAGIEMFPILCYASAWSGGAAPADDGERERFARWVGEVVTRYRGRVRTWEIWNEPNIHPFWEPTPDPALYAPLLKAAYAAARTADPECTVVGGVTSLTDLPFLKAMADHGAFAAMDAVSIHPYSLAGGPIDADLGGQIALVRRLCAGAGRPELPIWVTEIGWKADPGDPAAVVEQSAYLAQTVAILRAAGVERLFWFNLVDWSEKWGLAGMDHQPKRTLAAYRHAADTLTGSRYRGTAREPGLYGAVFAGRDGDDVAMLWTKPGTEVRWAVDEELRISSIRDTWGDPVSPGDGRLTVSAAPVYLTFEGACPWDLRAAAPRPASAVVNGGFEHLRGDDPYGWQRGSFHGGHDQGRFAVAGDPAGGRRCVMIEDGEDALWQGVHIPVMPGSRVRLRARVRGDDATGSTRIELMMLGGSGWPFRGVEASDPVSGSFEWRDLELDAVVPEDASYLRIQLATRGNAGRVWFDDVRLEGEGVRLEGEGARLEGEGARLEGEGARPAIEDE